MENENILNLIPAFESIKHTDEAGKAFWKARDLSNILGYLEYRNFKPIIEKAMEVCRNNANSIADHFVELNEMVELGSGAFRTIGVDLTTINYHLKQIFESGELDEKATIGKIPIVQMEGEI